MRAHAARIVLAFCLVALVASLMMLRVPREPSGQKSELERLIRQKGAQAAYEQFVRSVSDLDQDTQHLRSHIFGKTLYDTLGDSGFSICGDTFRFGCAHGFIARALQIEGIGAVKKFAESCQLQG